MLHREARRGVREINSLGPQRVGRDHLHGALPRDHVPMFAEILPHIAVRDYLCRAKGHSSRKIQQEFEHIQKRYWEQRFWQ